MSLQKSNIVLIIGPLSEVVESSVEEAVHDGHDPREIFLIEKRYNYEQKINWSIVDHLEDERLYLITDICDGVYLFTHIQFRHTLLVLFRLPNYDLHCLTSHIHVVEHQVAVCKDEGEAHDYPPQIVKSEVFEQNWQNSGNQTCLKQRSPQHSLQFDTLGQYFTCLRVSVQEYAGDPGGGEGVGESDEEVSEKSINIFHYSKAVIMFSRTVDYRQRGIFINLCFSPNPSHNE